MASDRAIDSATVLASVSYALSERDSEIGRLRRRSDKQYTDRRLLLWLHAEAVHKLGLDTARVEHAHDEEELRRQLLDALGDDAQTEAALRVVLPVLVAHEYTEDQALAELDAVKANAVTPASLAQARNYVAHLVLAARGSWPGWDYADEVQAAVEEALREIKRLHVEACGRPVEPAPKTLADKLTDAAMAEVNRINSTTTREPRVWRKGDRVVCVQDTERHYPGTITGFNGWGHALVKWDHWHKIDEYAPDELTVVIEDGGPARPRAWTGGARQPDGVDRVQAQNGDTFGRSAMDGRWYSAAGQGGPSFSWQELLAEHGIVFEVLTPGGGS
jgi:hypothetical protein